MTTHTYSKTVTERWEYTPEEVEALIRKDVFGEGDDAHGTIDVKIECSGTFRGVTVIHKYTEEGL